ncbi:MAG TPA: ComEC/Rec2 family competence protein [Caulobacteraceae bacterium]|jgi:competence protein ComEC
MAAGALAEARAQAGRLFIWTPVAFGAGAATYLSLKTEPLFWPVALAAMVLSAGAGVTVWRGWNRALVAVLTLTAVACAGFSVAKLRSDHVASPILPAGLGVAIVEGYVVDVDTPGANGPRILIAPTYVSHVDPNALPLRLRIVMPPGGYASPGQAIRVEALLDPPPGPASPGAYDFARDAWFNGEGGVGLGRSLPVALAAPPAPWRLRAVMAVNAFRWQMAAQLAADMNRALGGQAGDAAGLAVAVTTSHQDWLTPNTRDQLRAAGLAHMLAIAGLHTAALSGFVFFGLRFLIAAIPPLALRLNGKKLAAAGALVAVLAYLVLSGAHSPAKRAAITASVAFIAILLDRQAISLRSLALAALIVLLGEPEAVVQPGFEMSFCATASLVALAEVWPRATRATDLPWHIGLIQAARDNAVALFMVSLVAGAATGPFAIQHFNRIANFGVFANLTADLVASVAMMPALAMALLAELFNHNAALPALWVAGWAARGVVTLGHLFATAPNAGMAASTAPQIALILSYLGILFACLWKGHLRWLGVPLAAAVALWPRPAAPPIWIASDGADAAIAVKGQEVVLRPGVRSYATGVWAQRRGLGVPADAAAARTALFDCDYWSCVAKPGVTPALGIWWTRREPKPDRLGELCEGADILVIRADVSLPGSCRDALVLRPTDFAAGGAAELYPAGKTWRVVWSQPIRGQRPWTHASE